MSIACDNRGWAEGQFEQTLEWGTPLDLVKCHILFELYSSFFIVFIETFELHSIAQLGNFYPLVAHTLLRAVKLLYRLMLFQPLYSGSCTCLVMYSCTLFNPLYTCSCSWSVEKIWDKNLGQNRGQTDGRTDRWTDRWTDKTRYRVAPQLKIEGSFSGGSS